MNRVLRDLSQSLLDGLLVQTNRKSAAWISATFLAIVAGRTSRSDEQEERSLDLGDVPRNRCWTDFSFRHRGAREPRLRRRDSQSLLDGLLVQTAASTSTRTCSRCSQSLLDGLLVQ